MILIDQKRNGYFVKFGAHPDMSLALERCLTEMFQLRNIEKINDLVPFEITKDETEKKDGANLRNIFHNGAGRYHANFFNYEALHSSEIDMYKRTFNDNSECLHFILNLMKTQHWSLLIRDVGFLGFPAFHIVSPGISEINNLIPSELDLLSRGKGIRKDIKKLRELDKTGLEEIATVLEEEMALGNNEGSLSSLSRLPFSKGSIPGKIEYNMILVAIYIATRNFEKALKYIRIIISKKENLLSAELSRYFECIRDYLCIILNLNSSNNDMIILERFYSHSLLQKVRKEVAGQRKIFSDFPTMTCPDCKKCIQNKVCVYENIRNLHGKLKREMAFKFPDQSGIRKFLAKYLY